MSGPILITGAAGRIGATLTQGLGDRRLLLTDIREPEVVPDGARFVAADVTDAEAMRRLARGSAAVVHLAGHPNSTDWEVVERLNIRGTRTVLEAGAEAGARLIYASSIHVAGLHPADAALTAEMAPAPDGPYGLSKLHGENLLRYLCVKEGLQGFALRICSFRPRPGNARELRTWISPGDTTRLVRACLDTPAPGFQVIWGVSNNARAVVDRASWDRIGYAPEDDAENYVQAIGAEGVDTRWVSEHPLLGGAVVPAKIAERFSG